MIIKRIFLDVDDVLFDFTLAALVFTGIDLKKVDLDSYYERFGYDIVRAVNFYLVKGISKYTPAEFWASLSRSFWANLKKTEECDFLIEMSQRLVGRENVFLLTAPIQDPECAAGKMELIRDKLPRFWDERRYMIAPPKHACASPSSLLIDDSDKNVNLFRKAGGMASLLPRPWNSDHKLRKQPLKFTRLA